MLIFDYLLSFLFLEPCQTKGDVPLLKKIDEQVQQNYIPAFGATFGKENVLTFSNTCLIGPG